MTPGTCPLCAAPPRPPPTTWHGRRYHDCPACGLLHLDPADRLPLAEERAHYATHRNDPADPGYRAFLDRLAVPLVARLRPGASGLDYGAGPGPTLSVMLRERGFPTVDYDPAFAPEHASLAASYDFITCTEVAEHFLAPAAEFARLFGMLRPGGVLAIMTELVPSDRPLGEWRYLRDPTHVSLYREMTMRWIARHFDRQLEMPSRNVAFFTMAPP